MNLENLSRSLSLIIRDIRVNKNLFILMKKYLNYLHKRRLRSKNYILNLRNLDLKKVKYKQISPGYKIDFTENEKEFASKINILKEDFQKVNYQKEVFTCCMHNVKYYGISGGISYNSKIVVESMFNKKRR